MIFRRIHNGLIPIDDDALAFLNALAYGADVVMKCLLKRQRSVRQHRLFFAMLKRVFENQDYYPTLDALRHELLIKLGRIDSYEAKDGTLRIIPKSIAFGNMTQEDFQSLMNDTIDFLCKDVVPHWPRTEFDEFMDMAA